MQVYYRRTAQILPLANTIGIPVLAIDATLPPEQVSQEAIDFIVRRGRSYTEDPTDLDAAA
ncbi:MAG: hypothetical protein AUI14_08475 [Actinobacteria bacterium 13_2_20CM_2_71_6]|nr:MAG: hypothetical protein AUI14_08475 [Actinobacteria bacterium 13_2_20CM_2_71_6]